MTQVSMLTVERRPYSLRQSLLRSRLLVAGFTGLVVLALLAVGAVRSIRTAPGSGGTVAVDLSSSSLYVNPLLASTDTDTALTSLIFPGLLAWAPEGSLIPRLAQSWSVSATGKTYTAQLRTGLKWQNGNSVTSKDVAATYRLLASPSFPGHSDAWTGATVSTPNSTTVVIHLPNPDFTFGSALTTGIVPEGFAHSSLPVGSGEYEFERATRSSVVLTRSPVPTASMPLLDGATFRTGAGAAHGANLVCRSSFKQAGQSVPTTRLLGIAFNFKTLPQRLTRLALIEALATSRNDGGSTLLSPTPNWPAGPAQPLLRSPLNPTALMHRAGWRLTGNRWMRHGNAFQVALVAGSDTSETPSINTVIQVWRSFHVVVSLTREPFANLVRKSLYQGSFGAAVVEWDFGGPDYNPSYLWGRSAGLDFGRVHDLIVWQLAAAVGRTASRAGRDSFRNNLSRRLIHDGAAVGLAFEQYNCRTGNGLNGFIPPALAVDSSSLVSGLTSWYVSTRIVFRNPL